VANQSHRAGERLQDLSERSGIASGPPCPPFEGEVDDLALVDAVEQAMDDAGFEVAHIVGNSLGGYVSLQLASRGRAQSVVALAPAGGWAHGDESYKETHLILSFTGS
jgi:pimeloyl-ACP methyl ester carboxylesterase